MSKEPDPIIFAIDGHRKAYAEYARVAEDVPLSTDGGDHERVLDAAFDDKEAAALALAMTEPTTLAGAIALLDYVNDDSERALELATTPVPAALADGVRDWPQLMSKSLAKGLRRIETGGEHKPGL